MTDHTERDRQRRDLCDEHTRVVGAIHAVGLDLGWWAGLGDWGSTSAGSRDRAGLRALVELDAAIGQLVAFRERLAEAVRNPSATEPNGDDQP